MKFSIKNVFQSLTSKNCEKIHRCIIKKKLKCRSNVPTKVHYNMQLHLKCIFIYIFIHTYISTYDDDKITSLYRRASIINGNKQETQNTEMQLKCYKWVTVVCVSCVCILW